MSIVSRLLKGCRDDNPHSNICKRTVPAASEGGPRHRNGALKLADAEGSYLHVSVVRHCDEPVQRGKVFWKLILHRDGSVYLLTQAMDKLCILPVRWDVFEKGVSTSVSNTTTRVLRRKLSDDEGLAPGEFQLVKPEQRRDT